MRVLSYHRGFDEYHSRESKIVVFRTANFHSQGVLHFLILSHCVASCAEDSCNLMFWIKGNDAIAVRKVEGRATKFFEIPSLTKKLWKFRLRRKIRISGSERQIMREAIIRWSVRSQFSPSSMGKAIAASWQRDKAFG